MKYKSIPALICAVLFLTAFFPAFASSANSGKQELTTIDSLSIYQKGCVILCGDTNELEETIAGWKFIFSDLAVSGDAPGSIAFLDLEYLDTSELDIYTPGTYNVRAIMQLQPHYLDDYYISDENRTINIPVYISEESGYKLHLVMDASFRYEYAWYSPDGSLPLQIEYFKAGLDADYLQGDLVEVPWTVCTDDSIATTTSSSLSIHKPIPQGYAYYFRVKLENTYTDAVRVAYSAPPAKPDVGTSGNRDGDDHEEPELPDLIQPVPETSNPSDEDEPPTAATEPPSSSPDDSTQNRSHVIVSADSASAHSRAVYSASGSKDSSTEPSAGAAVEIVTSTKTTLSGSRIRILLASQEKFITFAWNNICLRIPDSFFETLNLADDSLFSVEMTRNSDNAFALTITCDGRELTSLASSSVQFLMDAPKAALFLYLNGSKLDTAVTYEDGCAVFSITRTGTYELGSEGEAAPLTVTNTTFKSEHSKLLIPAAAILILICAALFILYLKFRKKGGVQ